MLKSDGRINNITQYALWYYKLNSMKKVLVINDDRDFQFLMKQYLERLGYKAYTIDDDEPVFRHIETTRPDLIILDIQNERDKKICKTLKEKEKMKDIRLVLLIDQEKESDLDCKPDAILRKPFEPNQFLDTIRRIRS